MIKPTPKRLRAPFPYPGGKGTWSGEINARLGDDLGTYVEPFAGSLAVLLSRQPSKREVITDTSSFVCNAWRSMAAVPGEVAEWCDWPANHDDLVARRKWLIKWASERGPRVAEDADWYDAKAAGWWIWVVSNSIDLGTSMDEAIVKSSVPWMCGRGGSHGVVAQRTGGSGGLPSHERWLPWFDALARRLKRVIVLNRSWESAVTNSAMALRAGKPVGVLLDPPYVMETQKRYGASEAEVNAVAQEAWEWALLNGERFRIAYCHKLGSFWFPDDWTVVTKRFTGRPGADPLRNMDAVAFSPACLTTGGE